MKKIAKILAVCMLAVFMVMTFASCGLFGLDLDKVEDRLEDKDYTVSDYSIGGNSYLNAFDDDDNVFIAVEYEDADEAKDAYDEIKDNWDNISVEAEEDGLKATYGKKGNVVYYGTVKGVKDALGFPSNLLVFKK